MRRSRSYGLGRPLTLLRAFLIVSAAILAVGAVALSSRLSSDLHAAVLKDTGRDVNAYVDAAVASAVVRGGRVTLTPAQRRRLAGSLRLPDDVRGLNVYTRTGRLVFSSTRPDRIGRVRSSLDLRQAIQLGEPSATELDPMGTAGKVVKVWAPLTTAAGRPVGAAEVSLDDPVVTAIIADKGDGGSDVGGVRGGGGGAPARPR